MTCKDCIHEKVCDALIKSGCPYLDEEVPADAFCMEFRNTADVVPKSEEGAECPTCYGTGRIGTTNWLTKNMTKKQIAEEKAKAIAEHEQRIKTEVAREIFEEIEEFMIDGTLYKMPSKVMLSCKFAELKKKYVEGEG